MSAPLPPPPTQRGTDSFFASVRGIGLVRTTDRWVGGVAGGLARRFAIDPLVVRGLLAVSVLLGGLGLVLYGIAWLLLPEEADGRIHAEQLVHGDVDVAVLGAVVAIIAGLSAPGTWVPWFADEQSGWWRGLVWLAALALIVVVVVTLARRGSGPGPATSLRPPGPAWPAPTYPLSEGVRMSTTSEFPPAAAAGPTADAPTADLPGAPAQGAGPAVGDGLGGPAAVPPAPTGWAGGPGLPGGPPAPPFPPGSWAPPPGPVTAIPRTERGPGGAVLGVVTALTLLVLAGLWYAERVEAYDGPVVLTAMTIGLVLVGGAIVVAGLRGRTSGGLTALAIVGLLVAAPVTAAVTWDEDGAVAWDRASVALGEVDRRPTTVAAAEDGIQLGAGSATLDLTAVPLRGARAVEVPIQLGAGELTVILPADAAVTADVELGAGEITWLDEPTQNGTSGTVTFRTDAATDGDVDLALDVEVGLGSITVVEEER